MRGQTFSRAVSRAVIQVFGRSISRSIGRPIAASLFALGAFSFIAPTAQAGLFDDEEARKAILEIRAKLTEQQRSIDGLGKQASDLSSKIDKSVEPAIRSQLDLQNQIETMRQEIAKLRGQLEVQTNELAQTQKRQRDVYADLDTRLKKYEPSQVQVDGKTVAVDQNEKRTYEAALAQFRAGDFRTSQAGFQTFVAQYPESAFTPSAIFWMGSAQFALKDYKNTITTNQLFLGKYADHPRAPDALLNVAYAQIETGDRRTARKTLETVVEKYADTPAAQTAKERMTSLR
jgi:tol-pal system protein YbgF